MSFDACRENGYASANFAAWRKRRHTSSHTRILRRSRRRCVVKDAPPTWGFSEEKREASVRCVIAASEFPTAVDHRIRITQRVNFQVRETQRAHLFRRGVAFAIPVEHGLPSSS